MKMKRREARATKTDKESGVGPVTSAERRLSPSDTQIVTANAETCQWDVRVIEKSVETRIL